MALIDVQVIQFHRLTCPLRHFMTFIMGWRHSIFPYQRWLVFLNMNCLHGVTMIHSLMIFPWKFVEQPMRPVKCLIRIMAIQEIYCQWIIPLAIHLYYNISMLMMTLWFHVWLPWPYFSWSLESHLILYFFINHHPRSKKFIFQWIRKWMNNFEIQNSIWIN